MSLVKINLIIKTTLLMLFLNPILVFAQNNGQIVGYVDVGRVIKESHEMINRKSEIDNLRTQNQQRHEDFKHSQFLIDVELDILNLERTNYISRGEAVPDQISTAIYNYEAEKKQKALQNIDYGYNQVKEINKKVHEYNMRLDSIRRVIDTYIEMVRKEYKYPKVYKDLRNAPVGSQYYDLTDIIINILNQMH